MQMVAAVLAALLLPSAGALAAVGATAGDRQPLAARQTAVVEDNAVGTGRNQVSYTGGAWIVCGGCIPPTGNNFFRYSLTAGATATVRFTGTQVRLHGVREAAGGIAAIRVDGTTVTTVDTYAPSSQATVIFDSGELDYGTHTL
ncbi:MAG: hypothetical protein IRZ08_16160, partial [Frankia sp.]|nr:hypothetical protein [Frankia sp.]